jgi:hypothetical protein
MKLGKNRAGLFIATAVALALIFSAYLFGAYSYPRNLWPIELLRQIKESLQGQATAETVKLAQYDSPGRLTFYPGKTQVECPFQARDTGVLLIIGQSNAANFGQKKFTTQYPSHVVNYFEGRCYVASFPLLGAEGHGSEFVTPLADQLISKGTYTNIVIIAAGVGGSPISRWRRHGDINDFLISLIEEVQTIALIKKVQTKFRITDVIWHQGESDGSLKTTAKVYVSSFHSLLGTLTERKVTALILVSIATRWCSAGAKWTEANSVAIGQRMLIDNKRIFLGADTDKLVELKDRYNSCHFSESGQIKTAEAFADSISAVKNHKSTIQGSRRSGLGAG